MWSIEVLFFHLNTFENHEKLSLEIISSEEGEEISFFGQIEFFKSAKYADAMPAMQT